jgi:hypothetical protein
MPTPTIVAMLFMALNWDISGLWESGTGREHPDRVLGRLPMLAEQPS